MSDRREEPTRLGMRESERDSAELARDAASAGLGDAMALLDAAHAELRRIEAAIDARRVSVAGAPEMRDLDAEAYDARDTVAACQAAVHEAMRVVAEYDAEFAHLEAVVRDLRSSSKGEA